MNDAAKRGSVVIGVDIGGTCTDVAMIDEATNRHSFYKTETIPGSVEEGVVNGIVGILEEQKRSPQDCAALIHGTTLALNAVLTRSGAKVGLLVTEGFGDVLEVGRLQMPDPFNFYTRKPQPLIRKRFVREVDERILGSGKVDTPLNLTTLMDGAEDLLQKGAEILVVCFINAFRNSAHETAAAEAIRATHPSIPVMLSSEVWPEIREYERTMAAVVNAFVSPVVSTYLGKLQERLKAIGLKGPINITTSNGGMLPARLVRERPGTTLFSGPASGIIASARLALACNLNNLIAFDMGGTSSDFAVLDNAQIPYSSETRIGDLPIIFPSVDVVSIGAGGGSIARLDNMGVLKVGPESAGADPGPACYGRGGVLPTVTDAYVVSGLLDPLNFLGGRVQLDVQRAINAVATVADRTKYSRDQIAEGIMRVATSNLVLGIGKIEGRIGVDVRDYSILAYGGAGPTHACMLADQLGIRRIVIPPSPGTFCALGSLSADFRMDFVKTLNVSSADLNWDEIRSWYTASEQSASAHLDQEVDLLEGISAVRSVDMRYEGQGFSTEVALPSEVLGNGRTARLGSLFHERYEQLYGVAQSSVPSELINLRLTIVGQRKVGQITRGVENPHSPMSGATREVFFDGHRQEIPIFRREALSPGAALRGPCIVDQEDTTTFLRPGWFGRVDVFGILHLERE